MKIIEGLKQLKDLTQKAADLRVKIGQHCAILSVETPTYENQKQQVRDWLQAHEDLTHEIARLHVRISRTNVTTMVSIKIGDNLLIKSITEWVLRRRTLAALDLAAWNQLTDRGLKEHGFKPTPDSQLTQVKIVRFYEPLERDNKVTLYKSEPNLIDRTLEVTNATVDLLD